VTFSRAGLGAAVVGALTLLLSPSVVPPAAACVAAKGPIPVLLPALSVKVTAERTSYTRGQVAVVSVEVHMVRQDGPKVAGAEVTVAVTGNHATRTLYGKSDGGGISRLKLKTVGFPSGRLTAVATARALVADGYDCTGLVYYNGQGTADPLTTLR